MRKEIVTSMYICVRHSERRELYSSFSGEYCQIGRREIVRRAECSGPGDSFYLRSELNRIVASRLSEQFSHGNLVCLWNIR
jgi:hypothetical protein